MTKQELRQVVIGKLDEIEDPGCREFQIGEGGWPFKGFVVRQGGRVVAYQNHCAHLGHPLNWMPDGFLTRDKSNIICSSHGALYEIDSGLCIAGPCMGKTLHPVEVRVEKGEIIVRGPTGLR
jgi:nitrite reductase/ring-hydroxylating ferredoxin subunit